MKKQFNRMRQLANQTVGRAEKTEVLSEDLLQVEKRLELVKQVSHSTHKKLTACLQGQQGAEADKRSKKLPLTTLAQCLMEGSAILGDDTLLGKMLKLCGETEDKLAQELIHFELQVERDVIEPPTGSLSASSPQSTEHPVLDGMSPGESMSTDLAHFEVPSIHVELGSTLRLSPLEQVRRRSETGKRDSEEESESTAL
uniref:Rho GTPase activating protein 44 n=1 Tax=Molossus molossus TaxID=27622 RepID=A0A7J8CW64_MOLMO|nr:Rho GTPase activating protein 44 [Molossus molossus]